MGMFSFFSSKPKVKARSPRRVERMYRAPKADHLTDGFMPRDTWERSPSALSTIRARARDLAHNNPYAARSVSLLTSYVVGTGITFSFGGDQDYADAFDKWSKGRGVDYYGRLNIVGLQSLCARMLFEAGESLLIERMVEDKEGNIFPQYQCVDPSLIDENARPSTPNGAVVSGVEIDRKTGIVAGYHIVDHEDPTGGITRSTFYPASSVIHVFEQIYPGQVRGIPRGSQALICAGDVDNFISTQLIKAKTEACISVFVRSQAGNEYEELGEVDENGEEPLPETLSPGSVVRLREGEDISTVTPSGSGGFVDYIRVSLQAVAISYRVTYTLLTGDLGQTSFSSMKSDRDLFAKACDETREVWFYPLLERIEEAFRSAYELNTGIKTKAVLSLIPPSRVQIDPQKETYAQETKLRNGTASLFDEIRASGKEPISHLKQIAEERRIAADLGVTLGYVAPEIEGAEAPADDDDSDDANRDPADLAEE